MVRWVLFFLAGGFVTLFFDVRFEHGGILESDRFSLIPLAAAGVGFLGSLVGMIDKKPLRQALSIAMGLVAATGLLGLYYHTGLEKDRFTTILNSNHRAEHTKGLEKVLEGEPMPDLPPAIAPLGFTGLGMIGMIVLWPRPKSKER